MEGGNHILHDGRISRLPVVLGLLICAGILLASFGWFAHGAGDDEKPQEEASGRSVSSMVQYGQRRYEKLRHQEEQQEELDDPEELKAKAQVLMREAQDAYDYARELEGTPPEETKPSFEEDYGKYKQSTAAPAHAPEKPPRSESFEKARTSKTRIALGGGSGDTAKESTPVRSAADLMSALAGGGLPSPGISAAAPDEEQRPSRTLEAFQSLASGGDYEMDADLHELKTPWCLRQGSVIPAVLLSGVNSDLPGLVSAQVTDDVLDSVDAARVLIPRGTKITGQYGSAPAYGQERLFIAFDRLLFPGGQSMVLGNMPGAAPDGFSGFDAAVDTHFTRIVTGALLLSAVSAGASVAQGSRYDSEGRERYGSAFSGAASESLSTALGRIIERNINLSPTLEVRPGYLFNVAVTRDIYFKKPWNGQRFPS